MSETPHYVVATIKSWNIDAFHRVTRNLPGEWTLITKKSELTVERMAELNPRYIFFPHWSWIVPDAIVEGFECVCFHMTDVPYGRGGSPLQNLIVRGHDATKLTALRMVSELDAGPVYAKVPLSLAGTAADILTRASALTWKLIPDIARREPDPVPQQGQVTTFRRRKPADGLLPHVAKMKNIYDHIRMLDGEGYPRAFLDHGDIRLEFDQAEFQDGQLSARVIFKPKPEPKS